MIEHDREDEAPVPVVSQDIGTTVSAYFRDMAGLSVLRPEEELAAAKDIFDREIALWAVLLSHAPALALVLGAIEVVEGVPDVRVHTRLLRRAAARQHPALARAVLRIAPALREADHDRLLITAALGAVRESDVASRGGIQPRWIKAVEQAYEHASRARNDFVRANLRLVISIARRFNHGRMALADLIQEGNLGLLKAVERYDHRRGFRFSTYASWWIRHAISRALADKGREVRLPVHMIDAQHRLAKTRRTLAAELGRDPTSEELAAAARLSVDKVEKMRTWVLEQSISLDRPVVGDDEGRVLGDVLEDPDRDAASPIEDMERAALVSDVHDLVAGLSKMESDILRLRFGMGDEDEMTLKEIGERYGLSRERIRQIQELALAKLREKIAERS